MEHFYFALVLLGKGYSHNYTSIPMQTLELCQTAQKEIQAEENNDNSSFCIRIKHESK